MPGIKYLIRSRIFQTAAQRTVAVWRAAPSHARARAHESLTRTSAALPPSKQRSLVNCLRLWGLQWWPGAGAGCALPSPTLGRSTAPGPGRWTGPPWATAMPRWLPPASQGRPRPRAKPEPSPTPIPTPRPTPTRARARPGSDPSPARPGHSPSPKPTIARPQYQRRARPEPGPSPARVCARAEPELRPETIPDMSQNAA